MVRRGRRFESVRGLCKDPGAAWQVGDPLMFDGAQQLPDAIANESQWLHEREWRVPHDVVFGWGDVKFLIVPAPDWVVGQAHQYGVAYGAEYEQHFAAIPVIAIDATGQLLYDGSGIWAGNP
jgi:hypothetical protein